MALLHSDNNRSYGRAHIFNCSLHSQENMAERFRRIKKKEPRPLKHFFQNKFWILGLILVVAVGLTGWFYLRPDVFNQNNSDQVRTIDRALAAVICRAGECFWLNKEGISFDKNGKTAGNLVMNLEDNTGRGLEVGVQLLDPGTIAELFFLRRKIYEDLGIGLRAGEIDDTKLSDFNFTTKAGWTLKISTIPNAYKTLETLKQTIAEIKKTAPGGVEGLEYVDLRIPNKVYYKFR